MSRITRVTAIPFGMSGTTDDFETFGSTAVGATDYSKDIAAIQATSAWLNGWRPALIASKAPVLQDMNGKMLVDSNLICYLFQEGTPEFDSGTTYNYGSIVKSAYTGSGNVYLYVSIVDANTGNALPSGLTSNAHWQIVLGMATNGSLLVPGTTTNDGGVAGQVGEFIDSVVPVGSAVNLASTGTFGNITSIPLTAGDWDVAGFFTMFAGTSTGTVWAAAISAFSGNTTTDHVDGYNATDNLSFPTGASTGNFITIPRWRVQLSAPTTIYMKMRATYSLGQPTGWGNITARRMR